MSDIAAGPGEVVAAHLAEHRSVAEAVAGALVPDIERLAGLVLRTVRQGVPPGCQRAETDSGTEENQHSEEASQSRAGALFGLDARCDVLCGHRWLSELVVW